MSVLILKWNAALAAGIAQLCNAFSVIGGIGNLPRLVRQGGQPLGYGN